MARRPTKIKADKTGTVHLSFMVDAALVRQIDEEAERMEGEDPYKRKATRTHTVTSLILDGLKARADRRSK